MSTYIYVNGIMDNPTKADSWTHDFLTYTNALTEHKGDHFIYFSDPLIGTIYQSERVEKFITLLNRYSNQDVVLVGHSNGCDIIVKALTSGRVVAKVEQIHLLSAATNSDFVLNGLNDYLRDNKQVKLFLYCSKKDLALELATIVKDFHIYGNLGLVGAQLESPLVKEQVVTEWHNNFNHTDWFKPENRFATWQMVCESRQVTTIESN